MKIFILGLVGALLLGGGLSLAGSVLFPVFIVVGIYFLIASILICAIKIDDTNVGD